jgi:hypothetical protein
MYMNHSGNLGCRIADLRYEIDARCKVQGARCKVQGSGILNVFPCALSLEPYGSLNYGY